MVQVPGLSIYPVLRRTVKNPPTPATSGGAPGRWHLRKLETARTRPRCDGSWAVVPASSEPPGWSRRIGPSGLAWCGRWRDLALGLHAQMRSHFLEGDLQLPAQHKPFQNLRRFHGPVSAQQSLCVRPGGPEPRPSQGHGRLARAIPDRRLRGEFHRAGRAVVGYRGGGPGQTGMVDE